MTITQRIWTKCVCDGCGLEAYPDSNLPDGWEEVKLATSSSRAGGYNYSGHVCATCAKPFHGPQSMSAWITGFLLNHNVKAKP